MLQLNTGNLYKVLKDFYTLTKIRIVLFDSDFQEVLSYPKSQSGFCGVLRQNPKEAAKCQVSDKGGCQQCACTKNLAIYRCHAGLTEAVMPILERDNVLGYVMFGQILPGEDHLRVGSRLYGLYPQHIDEISKIPVKTEEELNAAATVLQMLTSYVISNHWVAPGRFEFIQQLDSYIQSHISQNIVVEDLCQEFHISRTRLYRLSNTYLGCGLAEYVRTQRILCAQQLLVQTNFPVSEIANMVGFPEYNYFSRIFHQVCGCSARNYRVQNSK